MHSRDATVRVAFQMHEQQRDRRRRDAGDALCLAHGLRPRALQFLSEHDK